MNLQQLLLILRARAKIVLYIFVVTVLTTMVVTMLQPKEYTATSSVVIDVRSPDPIAGMVIPGLMGPGYMDTQVEILSSHRVAQRAVKLLRMDENPAIQAQWREATEGQGSVTVWLASLLQRKLEIKPSRGSNVISVNYSAADPGFATTLANTFAQAYIDINLELKVEPARLNAIWFDEQTKMLRDKLEEAQAALSSYQQKTGIVVTDENIDFEKAKLNEISSQLTNAQAQTSDSLSKKKTASGSDTLTEVMQNPLINTLKSDIARLEAKQQDNNVNLGKNHPQTIRAESELASLRAKLASETLKISGSLGTSYTVGKQREIELLEAIEKQKARVLQLSKERDEISVLKREVDSAKRAFDNASTRLSQTRLESLSSQTNVMVLNTAIEPTAPSKPRIYLNLFVSIFLGGLLGVGAALLLELGNRRVRSAEDLTEAIDLPVLATINSTKPKLSLREYLRSFLARRKTAQAEPVVAAS